MIEIPEMSQIRSELQRLIGIDEHVFLEVGDRRIGATFDPKQFEADRISAVQYVRFPLGPGAEHPNYRASLALTPESRESLI
jgi:hypothetical protein